MTDTRSEYISKAKENLDSIDARIVDLEAKAKKTTGVARREFEAKLSGIRESKDQMKRRIEELRLASKPAWEDLKHGTEKAWNSLSDAIDRAGERLQ